MTTDNKTRLHNWLFAAAFLVLLLLAVPWYWRFFPDTALRIVMGFPLWVFASLAFSFLVSTLLAIRIGMAWPTEHDEEAPT